MCSPESSLPTSAETEALNELTAQLSQFNWKDSVVDKAERLLYSSDINDNIQGVMSLKAMLCIGREEVYEVAQEVIDAGVTCRLVEFLNVDNRDLQCPAAFCLTNVAAGLDSQTQIVVQAGAIDPLIKFLSHPDPQLRRQAVFCLANIAGSTQEHRIMLAEHPQFFSGLFSVARMATDLKIVELVCWNLRNTCLFGGPSFQVLRPGIMFLFENILKQYWNNKDKSVCVGFALETLCAVCRHAEGRQCLLESGLFTCLMSILSRLLTNASSINESTLKCLLFVLISEPQEYRQMLVLQHHHVVDLLVSQAITGHCGQNVRELALKCLVCVVSDSNLRLPLLQQHENVLNITGRIVLDHPADSSPMDGSQLGCAETRTVSKVSRLCASFLFAQFILIAPLIPETLMKLMATSETVTVLLSSLEFISAVDVNDLDSTQCSLPGLLESTTTCVLQALVDQLNQGKTMQQMKQLLENPIERFLVNCKAANRLGYLLQVLPPETHPTITLVLDQLSSYVSSY